MSETTDPAVVRDLLADAQRAPDPAEALERDLAEVTRERDEWKVQTRRLSVILDSQKDAIGAAWEAMPDGVDGDSLASAVRSLRRDNENYERSLRTEFLVLLDRIELDMSDDTPHLPTLIATLRNAWGVS